MSENDYGKSEVIPATKVANITLSDTTEYNPPTRGIALSVAGDLKITDAKGNDTLIPETALSIGIIHPIRATKFWATGTAASGVVAFW